MIIYLRERLFKPTYREHGVAGREVGCLSLDTDRDSQETLLDFIALGVPFT